MLSKEAVAAIVQWQAAIGQDGGRSRTLKKREASRRNLVKARAVRSEQAAHRKVIKRLGS